MLILLDSYNILTGKLRTLEEQYSSAVMTVQEQKQLIAQLEEDLRSVNALSTMFRPDADGEASATTTSAEFVADAVRELSQECKNADPLMCSHSSTQPRHVRFCCSASRHASDVVDGGTRAVAVRRRLAASDCSESARALPQSRAGAGGCTTHSTLRHVCDADVIY